MLKVKNEETRESGRVSEWACVCERERERERERETFEERIIERLGGMEKD